MKKKKAPERPRRRKGPYDPEEVNFTGRKVLDSKTTKYIINIVWVLSFLLAIVLVMLWFGLKGLDESASTALNMVKAYIPIAVPLLFIFFITRLILMVIKPALHLLVRMNVKSHADVKVFYMLVSVAVWILAIVVMFFFLSGDVGSLMTGVGVSLAALVFVLGKPVFNMFAWIIIIFRKPFVLGDRISINYGEYKVEGDVVDISLFYTFIRESGAWLKGEEHTGRMITVPNSELLDRPMFNFTRADPRVWDRIGLTITFESDHRAAKKIMLRAARMAMKKYDCSDVRSFNEHFELKDLHTHVMKGPEIEFEITNSGIELELLYLVHSRERGLVASVITETVLDGFYKHKNITFAYPHLTISDGRNVTGKPVSKHK